MSDVRPGRALAVAWQVACMSCLGSDSEFGISGAVLLLLTGLLYAGGVLPSTGFNFGSCFGFGAWFSINLGLGFGVLL